MPLTKSNTSAAPASYTTDHQKTEETLLELMKANNIGNLYEKFNKPEITTDIIWKLDDEMLKDDLKLTRIEILQYQTAKSKHNESNS